jgi:hypothetical protein
MPFSLFHAIIFIISDVTAYFIDYYLLMTSIFDIDGCLPLSLSYCHYFILIVNIFFRRSSDVYAIADIRH